MSELLLQALTSLGDINIDRYNAIFNALYNQRREVALDNFNYGYIRYQTMRHLDSLGHCEFDLDNRRAYICPPALISLPSSATSKAILVGARTPSIIDAIKSYIEEHEGCFSYYVEHQSVKHLLLPSVIHIDSCDHDSLKELSTALGINCYLEKPAAWCLVNFSAGIGDVTLHLRFKEKGELNWSKKTFFIPELRSIDGYTSDDLEKLVTYTNQKNFQRKNYLWIGNLAAEVDRDWGRYILLANRSIDVLLYDEKRNLLAVPTATPFPRILARAAVLCTGLAPEIATTGEDPIENIPANRYIDIYFGIPPIIAKKISERLSQNLIAHDINLNERGVVE